MELQIRVQTTPNPEALKYILSADVKMEGKASFTDPNKCFDNTLARDLLLLSGVTQVHFFENVITVTKSGPEWELLDPQIQSVLHTRMPVHNPEFIGAETRANEIERRKNLSPEIQKIEDILDSTIRPGLQGDGGDLEVVKLEGNTLTIRYQGACGSCPSSTSGTLYAIEDILRRDFNPEISLTLA